MDGSRAVRYGLGPVVALGATQTLEQGERLSLAQAIDGMQADFGASDRALGGLALATTLVTIAAAVPFGVAADRWRRTSLLAGAMALWTLGMGLNALAPGLLVVYLARTAIGFVEANGPAAVSLISDYYPVARRARMMGTYQLGSGAGALIGIGLAGALIDRYDWRAAFWLWLPFGVVAVILLLRQPEPARGDQDRDFHDDLSGRGDGLTVHGEPVPHLDLPPPRRVGTLDYAAAGPRAVLAELRRIPTMWIAVLSLTISQAFLAALGFWGIEFFKRAHGLSATAAGAYAAVLGVGSFAGLGLGGVVADRLLRRGMVNARILVPAVSSMVATALLLPAILVPGLLLSGVLFFVAGLFFTLPVAPAEAMMNDVVVAQLRGRAASARSVVRSLANTSPFAVGILSDLTDLRTALALTAPLFLVGGVVMLGALRTYPADLAYAVAESGRARTARAAPTAPVP